MHLTRGPCDNNNLAEPFFIHWNLIFPFDKINIINQVNVTIIIYEYSLLRSVNIP